MVVRGHDSPETAIDSVVAVPSNQWTLDFVNPKSVCVRRDGSCVAGLYPTASDSTRVEFETGDQDQASNLPEEIFDENAGLVYLDAKNPSVEINGKVPSAGYYVFIIHYNQPIHPQFDATVLLQNGQFYDANVAVPFCPSNAGCRYAIRWLSFGVPLIRLAFSFKCQIGGEAGGWQSIVPDHRELYLDVENSG